MRYDTYCRPLWSPHRKRPVYVVVKSMLNALPWTAAAQCFYYQMGPAILRVSTNRKIQRGAIINPTRELKRYLNER